MVTKFESWIMDLEKELGDTEYEKFIKQHLRLINKLYVLEVIERLEGGIRYLEIQNKNGTVEQGIKNLKKALNRSARLSDNEILA